MTFDGYIVTGFDGPAPHGGAWNTRPSPPIINHVRPDVWAFDQTGADIAVGEAKTFDDIDTAHTRQQLSVFGYMRSRPRQHRCALYMAVPRSASRELDRVLRDAGILGASHVKRLHVPDCLLEGAL